MDLQIIKGKKNDWEIVIGLEIHAQIISKSKLFSYASTNFGADPNTQVSLIDAGMPGMLPILNEICVKQAIKTGLGLNAKINLNSSFDRKNYFYPDLPQGYQISQFYFPIVGTGKIIVEIPEKNSIEVGITRIHLEQDAGKSMHDQSSDTLIDLNRSGIGLMEIVTEPDIRSSEGAGEFMKKLRLILRYLGTCDGDMEKGSMRCDANVSVRPLNSTTLGNRVEIKNVNSIKNLMKAIEYEAERQVEIIENGGKILQETRLFDANSGDTKPMRSKENAHDYRYFPDPDLLPIILTKEYVEDIKRNLPELPNQKKERYINIMGITSYDADVIVSDIMTAEFFEATVNIVNDPKMVASWITAELFGKLNKINLSIKDSKISPEDLGELIKLIKDNTISGKIAKQVFNSMFETGKNPKIIVQEKGLVQITNTEDIQQIIENVIRDHPEKVSEYQSGKDRLFGFFVGQVMKLSEGKANPEIVNKLLIEKLKN